LILDGLLYVLFTMPDLVTLLVDPSLVAIGFGLSEQLFRSGSSTHLEHRKSGRRNVRGVGRRRPDSETRIFAVGAREKQTLEEKSSAGRAPYIESLRPWLDVDLRDRGARE
jgi:hypothetical protein